MAIKLIETSTELLGHGLPDRENIKRINDNFSELSSGTGGGGGQPEPILEDQVLSYGTPGQLILGDYNLTASEEDMDAAVAAGGIFNIDGFDLMASLDVILGSPHTIYTIKWDGLVDLVMNIPGGGSSTFKDITGLGLISHITMKPNSYIKFKFTGAMDSIHTLPEPMIIESSNTSIPDDNRGNRLYTNGDKNGNNISVNFYGIYENRLDLYPEAGDIVNMIIYREYRVSPKMINIYNQTEVEVTINSSGGIGYVPDKFVFNGIEYSSIKIKKSTITPSIVLLWIPDLTNLPEEDSSGAYVNTSKPFVGKWFINKYDDSIITLVP